MLTAAQARAFIKSHGIVLFSAKGAVPTLVDAVAGEAIRGSWWGHPKGKAIFKVVSEIDDDADVLCCVLLGGRVTLAHRRLWPALVRLASQFPQGALDQVSSEHTPSGKHQRKVIPFPAWVPNEVEQAAARLSEEEARATLEPTGALASGERRTSGKKRSG